MGGDRSPCLPLINEDGGAGRRRCGQNRRFALIQLGQAFGFSFKDDHQQPRNSGVPQFGNTGFAIVVCNFIPYDHRHSNGRGIEGPECEAADTGETDKCRSIGVDRSGRHRGRL